MILFVCMVAMLAGCGQSKKEPDDYATNNVKSEKTDSAKKTSEGIAKDKIKVGVVHLSDPAEGSGYTYTHELGIQGMQKNLGLSDEQIVRKNNVDDTDAEEYPDIYFCHGTGYKSNGKNFTNYFGRIYQARYLSGIVAGMNTKTNKIGYVAAQDSSNSEVTGGIDAFAMGIASVNPDAEVYVKITHSWYAPEAEKAASLQLLDMGCDVMAQHCDTPYPQTTAQDAGVYGIGYNSDMRKETPDACLCSVIWNWSAYYTSEVQSIIDGTYDGKNYYGGMAEGLVDITDLADFCADGTQEKVDEARAEILSGKCNVFDGKIETNTGDTIGKKGKTLDDGTITGGINWYYKNVKIVE